MTKPELKRLKEIEANKYASFGYCPATTKKLHAAGLVDKVGGKVAKTGRIVWHATARITEAGRLALDPTRAKEVV